MGICCSSRGDTGMMTWFLLSASSCCCCSRWWCCCCCCCWWASSIWCWWLRTFPSRPFSCVIWDAVPPRLCLKSMAAPPPLLFGLRSKGFIIVLGMSWMTRGGHTSGAPGLPGHGASRGVEQRPLDAAGDTDRGYISSVRWWLLSGNWVKDWRWSSVAGRGWICCGGDRLFVVWWGERERCRSSIVGGCWLSGSVPRGGRRTVSGVTKDAVLISFLKQLLTCRYWYHSFSSNSNITHNFSNLCIFPFLIYVHMSLMPLLSHCLNPLPFTPGQTLSQKQTSQRSLFLFLVYIFL